VTAAPGTQSAAVATPPFRTAVCLLWLAGLGLRLTVLALPPVIALVQADLNLSGTQIGVLSGLPPILFASVALPGSLLIARYGALAVLVAGLLVAGVASGLRGAWPHAAALYFFTVVMGAGIAVTQPALPPLVRQWLPRRMSFGAAVYTNGLLVSEVLPVMLTIPVVLPLLAGSWRLSFVAWGIPLVAIALAIAVFAPASPRGGISALAPRASWWPDWSDPLIWRLGFVFGSVNSVYFGSNTFLPGHLAAGGRPDLIGPALTALNFGQLPASLLMLVAAGRLERRAWPLVACGVATVACVSGIFATASAWTVLFAGMFGFLAAVVMTTGFTLPALLAPPAEVARLSAAMFTISYSETLIVSVLGGAAWDLSGSARFAFVPIGMAALPLIFLPPTIRMQRSGAQA
jgi:MFS transporter, CP family, cyanate transporter